ncbi:MAG: DUF1104 domain-containing protein [Epsilonproteobacteria bacterium]|nr:DUF1104 domain-containing protein [Campylobacterota bacterium]
MASDFSKMTMEQLNAMRGSVNTEDREAYRTEMQKRIAAMTDEQRAAYIKKRNQNVDRFDRQRVSKQNSYLEHGMTQQMMIKQSIAKEQKEPQ